MKIRHHIQLQCNRRQFLGLITVSDCRDSCRVCPALHFNGVFSFANRLNGQSLVSCLYEVDPIRQLDLPDSHQVRTGGCHPPLPPSYSWTWELQDYDQSELDSHGIDMVQVIAAVWGTEFIHFLAQLAIVHQNDLNNRTNCTRMI